MSPVIIRIATGLALVAIILVASSSVEARRPPANSESDDDYSAESSSHHLDDKHTKGEHLELKDRGLLEVAQCIGKLIQNLFKGEAKFPEECCKIPLFSIVCKDKARSIRLGYIQPANKCTLNEHGKDQNANEEEFDDE